MRAHLTTDMHAALQHLQRAVAFDVDGNTVGDVRERIAGAAVFDLVDDAGQRVGAFALTVEDGAVRCLAAGAEPGHALVQTILEFWEREARERIKARRIQCETRRRGLVRQLERRGFRVAYILTKEL